MVLVVAFLFRFYFWFFLEEVKFSEVDHGQATGDAFVLPLPFARILRISCILHGRSPRWPSG